MKKNKQTSRGRDTVIHSKYLTVKHFSFEKTEKNRQAKEKNEGKKINENYQSEKKLLFNNATTNLFFFLILYYFNIKHTNYSICVTVSRLVGHGWI